MKYQAFSCYNSQNSEDIRSIIEVLRNGQCKVFCDLDGVKPGDVHQTVIDSALNNSEAVLVFIGESGLGPWQKEEVLSSIWESISGMGKILIPVILPGGSIKHQDVPVSLRNRSCIKFEEDINDSVALEKIITRLREFKSEDESGIERPLIYAESRSLLADTIKVYDNKEVAERFYDVWASDIPGDKLESFLKHIPKKGAILDAGCGPGHHTNYIAAQNYNVTGIDLANSALAIAHRSGGKASFQIEDMRRSSFSRRSFDGVWACASCIHSPREFFNNQLLEFRRILTLGGHLGLTLLIGRDAHIESSGRFFESWSSKDVRKYLDISGFEIVHEDSSLLGKSTFGGKRVSNWVTFIAQSKTKAERIRNDKS